MAKFLFTAQVSLGFVSIELPVRAVSGNQAVRGTLRERIKRAREQRLVFAMNVKAKATAVRLPCLVTLTRVGKGRVPLDDDNLRTALKHCRDGVADGLGFDDSAKAPITWRYAQTVKGPDWAVRAEIAWGGPT